MKHFTAFLAFSLFTVSIQAQIRFNIRVNFGFPAQYITSLVATDSCYYVTGNAVTSISPYDEGIFFAIMDLHGEPVLLKTYDGFPGKIIEYYNNKLFFSNGYFYCSGAFAYPDNIRKPFLIKFTPLGDTVFVREYPSKYNYATWHNAMDGIRGFDDNFYLTANFLNKGIGKYNADIIKTDKDGNHTWTKTPMYIPPGLQRVASSLIQLTDSTIVLSTRLEKPGHVTNDFIRKNQIIRVDTAGNVLNYWTSPDDELRAGIHNDILQTQDGGLAFTMAFGTERIQDDSLNKIHMFWQYGGICKLNKNFKQVWVQAYDGYENPYSYNNFLNRLIELEDGSLVAAGYHFESYWPDSVWLPDYQMWDYWNYNGWIVKVSATGDSLWSRQYHYVVSPADEHLIYDIQQTNDGGFILCGQAGDMFHNPPPGQQGWLIKTDEYGCIVPDCQTGIEETKNKQDVIKIYPNPVRDYLNICLKRLNNEKVKGAKGRLVDLYGKTLVEFTMWQSDLTYILPVYNYPTGTYIFQYIKQNKIVMGRKVIVVR